MREVNNLGRHNREVHAMFCCGAYACAYSFPGPSHMPEVALKQMQQIKKAVPQRGAAVSAADNGGVRIDH